MRNDGMRKKRMRNKRINKRVGKKVVVFFCWR